MSGSTGCRCVGDDLVQIALIAEAVGVKISAVPEIESHHGGGMGSLRIASVSVKPHRGLMTLGSYASFCASTLVLLVFGCQGETENPVSADGGSGADAPVDEVPDDGDPDSTTPTNTTPPASMGGAENSLGGAENALGGASPCAQEPADSLREVARARAAEDEDDNLGSPVISGDGRYAFFLSADATLLPGLTGAVEVFRLDLENGSLIVASRGADGQLGNGTVLTAGWGIPISVSHDGNIVAFSSAASDLVADDENGVFDVFVRNIEEGTTRRVSVSSEGEEGNQESSGAHLSADGRFVVFESFATNLTPEASIGAFRHNLESGETTLVSTDAEGNAISASASVVPTVSADGMRVAFLTEALEDSMQAYVKDLSSGELTQVSVSSGGELANARVSVWGCKISYDGESVNFLTAADNLVDGDTNGVSDVFRHSLTPQTTERLSLTDEGEQFEGVTTSFSSSQNGTRVSFAIFESGTEQVFLRDLNQSTTVLLSQNAQGAAANDSSRAPSISAAGTEIVFASEASDLFPETPTDGTALVHWVRSEDPACLEP